MATATYPTNRQGASASAKILADGTAVIQSGSQGLGTGTYTVMTQIAADALGLPLDKVRVELGDTVQPKAPVSGGSQTVASVGPAVHVASKATRNRCCTVTRSTISAWNSAGFIEYRTRQDASLSRQ